MFKLLKNYLITPDLKKPGFTLIELLVVVIIIGVLVLLPYQIFSTSRKK